MKKLVQKFFVFVKRYKWLAIIVATILIIIGISIWRQANYTPQYVTDQVTRATVVSQVSESGDVQTEGQANITSPINGVIAQIYVENGDYVYTDQSLFNVRSLATDQEKAAALSAYQNAQSNSLMAEQNKLMLASQVTAAQKAVYDAQNNYNIVAKKFRHHEINPATQVSYKQLEVDSAKIAITAAQENLVAIKQKYQDADKSIEVAQSAEESAKLNLDGKTSMIVRASNSGTIANFNSFLGDQVGTTSLAAAAPPTLIIIRSNKLVFKSQINEIDIPKLKLNQAITINIDAFKDKTFEGKIKKIDSVGTNTQGVISYNVYFSINNPDPAIRSGMSGNITVEAERRENVLSVANSAIKPYQNGKAVQVFIDDKQKTLKYVPVKVGLRGLERTEILEGVNEGQTMIVSVGS